MNKSALISAVSKKTGLTKTQGAEVVEAFVETVKETLKDGEKVSIVGFGTFEVRERAARSGINPQTKEKIEIPASKAPAFKAGKALKDALN